MANMYQPLALRLIGLIQANPDKALAAWKQSQKYILQFVVKFANVEKRAAQDFCLSGNITCQMIGYFLDELTPNMIKQNGGEKLRDSIQSLRASISQAKVYHANQQLESVSSVSSLGAYRKNIDSQNAQQQSGQLIGKNKKGIQGDKLDINSMQSSKSKKSITLLNIDKSSSHINDGSFKKLQRSQEPKATISKSFMQKIKMNQNQLFIRQKQIIEKQEKYEKQAYVYEINKSAMKKNKNNSIFEEPIRDQPFRQVLQIEGEHVKLIIHYFAQKLDIQYNHKNKNLKQQLTKYGQNYLQTHNHQVQVQTMRAVLPKIDGDDYQKNKEIGNYYFYPFFKCLRFQLVMSNGSKEMNFIKPFKVIGKCQVQFVQIKGQKQNNDDTLTENDRIQKLIKLVCNKNQQDQKSYKTYLKKFIFQQNIKIIKDLFQWQKQNFQKLKLKTNFIFQMMDMVQKTKYQSFALMNQKRRKIKQSKKECIRTANSHKILRYAIYKTQGMQQLSKISYVDYDNMIKAIDIVKEQIVNEQLLNQLQEYFYQFTHVPKEGQRSVGFSRGLTLFGPPGTGKTQLTEALPNLIGFHLISTGLSAADFMKSLVGQSSRMILNLVNRANLSPHLLCSVAIDEVDGLVPDRKDKDQKNKGQGISMLLSVIGGIKDVPNLLYLTSTNHLRKIDEAIRRRLSGQFQVGRPNPQARQKIILEDLIFLKNNTQLTSYLIKVTSNFTGAALKRLNAVLMMKISRKRHLKLPQNLTKAQVVQGATQIAKQFSITLGMSTFPEIYSTKINKKYIFRMQFLEKIAHRLVLVTQKEDGFQISYANKMKRYVKFKGTCKLKQFYQVFKDIIAIEAKQYIDFQSFIQWIESCLYNTQILKCRKRQQVQRLLQKSYKQPTLAVIKQLSQSEDRFGGSMLLELISKKVNNLYIFYYIPRKIDIMGCYRILGWDLVQDYPYSGRILIQLNQQSRMAFQLNTTQQQQTKFSFRHFMKTQKQTSVNDILPQLIEFFVKRQVSYILLIEYQLMLQNAAYDQQKMLEVIEQYKAEAMNYNKVAVIINVDSLVVLNQSSSDSSMGRSVSYSIADQNMYRLLLNYMRQFAMISKKHIKQKNGSSFCIAQTAIRPEVQQKIQQKQKWMAILASNPELAKLIKKDLRWPLTPDQRQQRRKQQQKTKQKRCKRCRIKYTEQENQKERKCMGHPGPIINLKMKSIQENLTVIQAKAEQLKQRQLQNKKQNKNYQINYIFACCLKGVDQIGQCAYRHISQQTSDDELEAQKQERQEEWQRTLQNLT